MKCLSLITVYISLALCSLLSCSEEKFDILNPSNQKNLLWKSNLESHIAKLTKGCSEKTTKNVTLTIFIHGTLGLRSNVSLSTALCLFHDCFSCSCYKSTVEMLRDDPTFYQYQAMQEEGLIPINPLNKGFSGSALFADMFDHNNTQIPGKKTVPERLYYTFGWSGMLSPTARYHAAKRLYKELKEELGRLKGLGMCPQITLVGYSHGGNVILNLERVWKESEDDEKPFSIDKVIFLGIPVQPETSCYIHSPLFKSLYNFYSRSDCVQCCDCFALNRFCSGRKFKPDKHGYLPEKLIQMEIKMLSSCDKCCACSSKKGFRIDRSPGHSELWTYAWTKDSYRTEFPLYPLPVAVFIPQLIDLADRHKYISHKLVASLDPETGNATVRAYRDYVKVTTTFAHPDLITRLKCQAWEYAPKDFHKEYQQRIKEIACQARAEIREQKGR